MKFKNTNKKREKIFIVSIIQKEGGFSWVNILPNRIICKTYEECFNFIRENAFVVKNRKKRLWQIWEDTYNDHLYSPTLTYFDRDLNKYTNQEALDYLHSD